MRLLAGLGLIGLLLLFVWERVDIVRVGYHVERLKAKKVLLQREQDELRVKVSALTAPDRLARTATEKLGMVPPQAGQVILVNTGDAEPAQGDPRLPEVRMAKSERYWRRP
jgi:cell division protein FtsL